MANFEYKDAREAAPAGIRDEIERFDQMSDEYKQGRALLYHILGTGTPDYKMDPADADYVDKAKSEQNCLNCRFAYHQPKRDAYICSQIRGRIRPEAWCRLWKD